MSARYSKNTLAYYSTESIAAVKSFKEQGLEFFLFFAKKILKGGVAFPVLDPVIRLDVHLVSRAPAAQW
jgi:hypothetical protein